MLELHDETVIYCGVPVDVAIELGHRLYKTAIFSGDAVWNAVDLHLEEFNISGFYDFPTSAYRESLAEIKSLVGLRFDRVPEMDAFITAMREGDDLQ